MRQNELKRKTILQQVDPIIEKDNVIIYKENVLNGVEGYSRPLIQQAEFIVLPQNKHPEPYRKEADFANNLSDDMSYSNFSSHIDRKQVYLFVRNKIEPKTETETKKKKKNEPIEPPKKLYFVA